ncbi:MAG: hypothetical protein WBB67_02055 [bacterium]
MLNSAFALTSLAIGILGIVLAFVFYRQTKRSKSLSFAHRSIAIFRDSTPLVSKLQVKYKDKDTQNLTLTHLAFWNSGNKTIRDIDLVENDPLRIMVEQGEILDAELLYETQKANAIAVEEPNDQTINLGFRFLDSQHGGVVRVVHTAISPRKQVALKGTLMGAGSPRVIGERYIDRMRRLIFYPRLIPKKAFKWIISVMVVIMTLGIFRLLLSADAAQIGLWCFALLLILMPYWMIAIGAHRRQLPKELEQYLEDFSAEKKA